MNINTNIYSTLMSHEMNHVKMNKKKRSKMTVSRWKMAEESDFGTIINTTLNLIYQIVIKFVYLYRYKIRKLLYYNNI